jgi:ApbE superfamily uncharacterized protein (UPF0280 family)
MREPAIVRLLPDGKRLHLHDGPIDLIVEAFGDRAQIEAAYKAGARRFVTVLDELCGELPLLRAPARSGVALLRGVVARRMEAAVAPFAGRWFITPMAAVAGAVAEEILDDMIAAAPLKSAYINNGGDIALHLARGESFRIGMVQRPDELSLFGTLTISEADPVRGIATSGWRGRSFSLGIADAVTVLADRASSADAGATIIANAVDLPGHPAITRAPANSIQPDTDLGDRLVTRGVGELPADEAAEALARGAAVAEDLIAGGIVRAAALCLQGETRVAGVAAAELQSTDTHSFTPSLEIRLLHAAKKHLPGSFARA